jgi:hypothetical protein
MADKENMKLEDSARGFVKDIQSISARGVELELKNRGIENFDVVLQRVEETLGEKLKLENKKEVDDLRKDFFVTFGLFASFITFVVGELSILKGIEDFFDKIGFSFLLVSLMLGFLFGVLFLVGDERYVKKYRDMSGIFTVFFLIGLAFIVIPHLLFL